MSALPSEGVNPYKQEGAARQSKRKRHHQRLRDVPQAGLQRAPGENGDAGQRRIHRCEPRAIGCTSQHDSENNCLRDLVCDQPKSDS